MNKATEPREEEIIVSSAPLSAQDERLEGLFDEMEKNSLETLEEAARQIITLSTTLLGAFFGLLALKDAPAYLGFPEIKGIGAGALLCFFLALFFALTVVSPQRYDFPPASLTYKRRLLDEMLTHKHRFLRLAAGAFGLGALLMLAAALDILIWKI